MYCEHEFFSYVSQLRIGPVILIDECRGQSQNCKKGKYTAIPGEIIPPFYCRQNNITIHMKLHHYSSDDTLDHLPIKVLDDFTITQ
jgi:hypothetical protein